jgi:hypothetical protein
MPPTGGIEGFCFWEEGVGLWNVIFFAYHYSGFMGVFIFIFGSLSNQDLRNIAGVDEIRSRVRFFLISRISPFLLMASPFFFCDCILFSQNFLCFLFSRLHWSPLFLSHIQHIPCLFTFHSSMYPYLFPLFLLATPFIWKIWGIGHYLVSGRDAR